MGHSRWYCVDIVLVIAVVACYSCCAVMVVVDTVVAAVGVRSSRNM